jgi:hypothetical protein
MTTSPNNTVPDIVEVEVTPTDIRVRFSNARWAEVPIHAFPRLLNAKPEHRLSSRLIAGGVGVHWEEIDEDISANRLYDTSTLVLTAEDLSHYDWQSVIDQSSPKQCYAYYTPLYKAAQDFQEEGDPIGARVFRLLGSVASYHPNYDSAGNPYGPMWQERTRRSATAEDLRKSELTALQGIVTEIRDPEFRARIADVLWEGLRDHRSAAVAVSAFLSSAKNLEDAEMWPPFTERVERALQLTLALRNQTLRREVLTFIERAINRYKSNTKAGLLCARLMESLLATKSGPVDKYAALSERLARRYAKAKQWDFSQQYWQLAAQWHQRAKRSEKAASARLSAAETMEKKAEDNLLGSTPSYSFAAHWMGRAFEAMRQAKAPADRVEQLHRRFIELERLATAEIQQIGVEFENIPGFVEATEKQAQLARDHVRGRSFSEALFRLAFVTQPNDPTRLRERLIKQSEQSPFMSLFGSVASTETGKVADTAPPLSSTSPEEREQAILKNMYLQARTIDWPTRVQFSIDPARRQIASEHSIRLRDFAVLVSDNPFVVRGREGLFARGMQAGFFGDWTVAIHLLVPQIEASIRNVFNQYGIPTSTLDADGIQDERDLGWLLNHERMAEIFGADIAFDLRGLLTERFGWNLRNGLAHGLLSEAAFYGEASEYIWWLTIRLCCIGERSAKRTDRQRDG